MSFDRKFAFGGVTGEITPEKIALREKQISDGMFLHTCFDYGSSLSIIRRALDAGGDARIFSKIYFNYPDENSCRHLSVWEQIVRFRDALGYQPKDWMVQISSMVPHQQVSEQFPELVKKAEADFNITKFLFETYPRWESNSLRILNKIEDLGLSDKCGFAFYDNVHSIGATKSFLTEVQTGGLPYATLRVLGVSEYLRNFSDGKVADPLAIDQLIDKNVERVLAHSENRTFLVGVTATGTMQHYIDLKNRLGTVGSGSGEMIRNEEVTSGSSVSAEDPYGYRRSPYQRLRAPRQTLKKMTQSFKTRSVCGWD